MSELSEAAAAALGVPEPIVQRSAAARAAETGMSVDEVLAAWAGGSDVPTTAPAPTPVDESVAAEPEPSPEEPAAPDAEEAPPAAVTPPAAAAPAPAEAPVAVPGKPPVLVGTRDNPVAVLVGAVGLFVALFLVGLVGPALPAENPGARTSNLAFSEAALRGREVYRSVGCIACHTQFVRPIVADVDLGAVTLNDSNQVLGIRRFGPDISNAGGRLTASQLEAVVTGLGSHPSLSLSGEDLNDLVAYLLESRTMEATAESGGGDQATEEEPAES